MTEKRCKPGPRPKGKGGVNKNEALYVRCTPIEKQIIQKKAEEAGLTMSEYALKKLMK